MKTRVGFPIYKESNMQRDMLKTIAGMVIIGLIVVATFLYGNKQRQDQVRKDEAAKVAQQTPAPAPVAATAPAPTPAPAPAASTSTGSTNQAPSGATAAVTKPAANTLQNSAEKGTTTAPAPAPTPTPVVATPKPVGVVTTTPTPTSIPDTGGSSWLVLVPVAGIVGLYQVQRTSKQRLRAVAIKSAS
jgi:hypothetical protein